MSVALQLRNGADIGGQFLIADAHVPVVRRLTQHDLVDHALQDLGLQLRVREHLRREGIAEHTAHVLAEIAHPLVQLLSGDLVAIHFGHGRIGIHTEVLLYAKQCKRNTDEDHDCPSDPTLGFFSDCLQHDVSV